MKPKNILDLARNRTPAETLLAGMTNENPEMSLQAGQMLVADAKSHNLSMGDYLRLAVDPRAGKFAGSDLNGYECALAFLGLPIRDDFDQGVVLQAAAETFNALPGTRALFPEVLDNILQWKYRQDQIENVSTMIAQSRGINGVELITAVIDDQASDYQQTGVIAEGARIPMRSVKSTQKSVHFHKFGGGYEFTYEFQRRVSLEVVAPYAARLNREVAIGQTGVVTDLILNGDGVSAAAPVVNASTLGAAMATSPAIPAGRMNWEIFLKWLISRAQLGLPIDTVIGNWDMYFEYLRMFAVPYAQGKTQSEILQSAGVDTAIANPNFNFKVDFAVCSSAPASKLIGIIKSETVEELVENGSDIEESVRAIQNQKVTYVRTKNHGYRLIFPDTRSVLNLDAVSAH